MLGKTEDGSRTEQQRMRGLHGVTGSVDKNLNTLWETVEGRGAWHSTVHGLQRVGRDLTEPKAVPNWGWSCRAHPCAEDLWPNLEAVWALVTGWG